VKAAKAAGMHVVATTNLYTEREDLSEADLVISCLGDPAGEKGTLSRANRDLSFDGILRVQQLIEYSSG